MPLIDNTDDSISQHRFGMNSSDGRTARPSRGVRSLTNDEFDAMESVGGVRGLIEASLPGLVYLVLYVVTQELKTALIGSLSIAALLVIARLIQRTPVTMAFSGVFGVAIGLFVAWRSGDAEDFYLWGFLVNAVYLIVLLVTVLVRWPGVGIIVELLKSGLTGGATPKTTDDSRTIDAIASVESTAHTQDGSSAEAQNETAPTIFPTAWRKNSRTLRAYTIATWIWIAMFTARLVVQLPLYFIGEDAFAALGAARLIMGLPLFALVLWLTWRLIRPTAPSASQPA